jgi:hypothetical protein
LDFASRILNFENIPATFFPWYDNNIKNETRVRSCSKLSIDHRVSGNLSGARRDHIIGRKHKEDDETLLHVVG